MASGLSRIQIIQRPTEVEDPVINTSPAGRCLEESDVTNLGDEAGRRQGRGRTAGEEVKTVVGQRMGPEEAPGEGHEGLHACQQVGTNQRQIRPSRPGESEATGPEWPVGNAGGRGCWTFGSSELGAICMFIIKLTLRAALNNSGGAGISLQCVSLGYKGRGAGWVQAPAIAWFSERA